MISSLIHKDQYELRLELDRRKTMLRPDAEEHKLIDHFYKLKPRQTEMNSAKIIWKAIHDQQANLDEIAIFKKWLQHHILASSCTLQDMQLPNINRIFASIVFHEQTSYTEHIAHQTIARAEEIAQHYTNIATAAKTKLQSRRTDHKNVHLVDQIINTILKRENNMQQHGVCELQRKLTMIFNQTPVEATDDQLNMQTK
ncbi:unnamed protein product [Rotaria sp. Silwood2]|nr:unnamed protein product [Rotaria sp. Silwood2]CAF2990076.1 unnamed protein product [Rotaria sp. Silwood2]CAF3367492.1 unnamed protein product [Rotaria sp. Silwood2]CAF4175151.1 unnamed protein product [Rotaria sp. Silwood2]CAF4289004.1 unnamed protein product [Rotaria sp. Silwood2]